MEYRESFKEKRDEQKLELGYTLKSGAKVMHQTLNPNLIWRAYKIHKIRKTREKYQKAQNKEPSAWSILKNVWQQDKCKKDILAALGTSLIGGCCNGAFGWTNGKFIESMSAAILKSASSFTVAGWAGVLIAQSSLANALGTFSMNLGNGVMAKIKAAEQSRLLRELRSLPQKFTQGQNAVERVGFAKQAADAKGEMVYSALRMFTQGTTALVAFGLMAKLSPEAAVTIAGCSAAAVGMIRATIKLQRSRNDIVKKFTNKTQAKLVDFMQNMPLIKNFHFERKSADITNAMVKKDERMQQKARTFEATSDSALTWVLNSMILGVGAYFAYKTGLNTGSIGTGLAIFTSAQIFVGRCNMVINNLSNLLKRKNTYVDSCKNFEPPSNFHINSGNEKFSHKDSKVVLKNVSYSYSEENTFDENKTNAKSTQNKEDDTSQSRGFTGLHNVNVEFEKGDIQVLAGRSGQGKSTLVNMIRHLDDVKEGSVSIGGVNVNHASQEEIQSYITQMEQETAFLTTFTMKENLELMIPDDKDMEEALIKKEQGLISEEKYERMRRFHEHPDETIRGALETAQIADVYYGVDANGRERYNQMYGSFSGGERQRLALARAILADKEITILDEPTGALDGETTMDVIAKFKEFAKTHNLIMITHSPDFVANAGKVVVVDEGRIVGDADAYQLIKDNKFIQSIFKDSPRQILESRRDVYKLMHSDTSKIEDQLVKETEVSAQYEKLRADFERDKKGRFDDMRAFVKRVHNRNVSDATLEAQKRVLSQKSKMSEAYVEASKKEILARRNKKSMA